MLCGKIGGLALLCFFCQFLLGYKTYLHSNLIYQLMRLLQVCTPYGNSTSGPLDPYSQIQCNVCHQTTDDSLLLLCDLCDSASHTYCVGLGFTVPEGDWFCHDCTVCRNEHIIREIGDDSDNETVLPKAEEHVTIFDMVQDSNSCMVNRTATRIFSNTNQLSPSVAPDRGNNVAQGANGPGTRKFQNVAVRATQSGPRTLQRCRNVHSRIRALRQNWNAFRNGSLSFSSSSLKSGNGSCQKQKTSAVLHDRSGQQHLSSSTSSQQSTTEDGSAQSSGDNRGSDDIDKAWKMMVRAKSMELARERTRSIDQVTKLPSSTGRASKDATSISSSFQLFKQPQFGAKDLGRTAKEKENKYCSIEKEKGKCQFPKLEKQKQSIVTTNETVESSEGLKTTHLPGSFKSSFSRYECSSIKGDVCYQNGSRLLQKNINGASSNVPDEQNGSSSLMDVVGSMSGASAPFYAKLELSTSSPGKADVPKERVRLGKDCTQSNDRKDNDAKSEIQSLVKLNMKILSRDKKLGMIIFEFILLSLYLIIYCIFYILLMVESVGDCEVTWSNLSLLYPYLRTLLGTNARYGFHFNASRSFITDEVCFIGPCKTESRFFLKHIALSLWHGMC